MGHVKAFLPNEQHTSVCTTGMLKPSYQMSNTHRFVHLCSTQNILKSVKVIYLMSSTINVLSNGELTKIIILLSQNTHLK